MQTVNQVKTVQNVHTLTLDAELEHARRHAEDWMAAFDDSRLHIPGAADLAECADLAARAPTPTLRGYVLGLLINN